MRVPYQAIIIELNDTTKNISKATITKQLKDLKNSN